MPAVSVIMPAYNVAPYIAAAIESVCAQTCPDWELIVVDDGSTDESPAITQEFVRRDRRVRLLSQENAGCGAARNYGLSTAQGEFIAILDADDLWSPSYLASQLAVFAAWPEVDIVTGNAWFLGGRDDGKPANPTPDPRPQPDLHRIIADETSIFIMSVFRRRVYDALGGFDQSMRSNEDYDFWLRAAVAGFRFYRNDEPLGHYRRRDDSLSASELKMLRGILRVYYKLRPTIADRPTALALLDAQIARFELERLKIEAREALEAQDFPAFSGHLAALQARRGGGVSLVAARFIARWAPSLLSKAYHFRCALRRAH